MAWGGEGNPGNKGNTRSKSKNPKALAKHERLPIIADMFNRGRSQAEMAEWCGVTQPQISNDLALIINAWVSERTLEKFEESRAREIAKINHLEKVAWEAFEKSCGEKRTVRKVEKALRKMPDVKAGSASELKKQSKKMADELKKVLAEGVDSLPEETMRTVKKQTEVTFSSSAGNPLWLDRVAWCIEMRVKLLGLIKTDINVATFINWDMVAAQASVPEDIDPIEQKILTAGSKG